MQNNKGLIFTVGTVKECPTFCLFSKFHYYIHPHLPTRSAGATIGFLLASGFGAAAAVVVVTGAVIGGAGGAAFSTGPAFVAEVKI